MDLNIGCANWRLKTIKAPEGALRVLFDKANMENKKRLTRNFLSMEYVYRIIGSESSSKICINHFPHVLSDETPNQEKEFSNDRSSSKSNQRNSGLSAKSAAIQILQA
jgi:hypothetical protein